MNRVVAIDGPSGSGKGTISQMLAQRLGWTLLDSGAMYRVVGLAALRHGVHPDQSQEIKNLIENISVTFCNNEILLNGEDVANEVRTESVGNMASRLAALPEVRAALLARQRAFAGAPGLVADGRDMGTVVFPHAQVKIFLTASAQERARRRYKQLKEKGLDVSLARLAEEIRERDERDRNRSVAPLEAAAEALEVESTGLSIEEVFGRVWGQVTKAFPDLGVRGNRHQTGERDS